MVAQDPQVSMLGGGLVRWGRYLIRVRQAVLDAAIQEPGQLILVKAEQRHIELHRLEVLQLDWQQVHIPFSNGSRLVVCDAICLRLFRRQVRSDVNRNFFHPQLLRRLISRVAHDNYAVLVHDYGLAPSVLFERSGHGVNGVVVVSGIGFVRRDVFNRNQFRYHA